MSLELFVSIRPSEILAHGLQCGRVSAGGLGNTIGHLGVLDLAEHARR